MIISHEYHAIYSSHGIAERSYLFICTVFLYITLNCSLEFMSTRSFELKYLDKGTRQDITVIFL
jgi:hypothetical protein